MDGIVKFAIPNPYVMNTGVPQWKSEAAVYTDGKQDVKIDFTAKDCNRDIEKTRRRVSALEYVMIPETEKNIRYITMKLDENERGNTTRLMKVKDMVLQDAHHYQP